MIRAGVDEEIDGALLGNFPPETEIVRIPEQPDKLIEVEFWIPLLSPPVVQQQWEHLEGVRVVQAPWAGVDGLRHIFPPQVTLCNARGVHDIPTAEWVVAAILAMQKSLPFYVEQQKKGNWAAGQQAQQSGARPPSKIKSPPAPMLEIAGATVLIVGYGAIGKAIETRLAGFGASFRRVAQVARDGVHAVRDLDELVGEADIVVLSVPLTEHTRGLMDRKRLAKMKPGALLVNAARGPVVDSNALLQALHDQRIRAAIDVTDPEPLPPGHALWQAPNLLLTPHVAGDSPAFLQRVFRLAGEQLGRFSRGEALINRVRDQSGALR
jgi:phosphoglycerate dehydrogenase-like enzyme